MKKTAGIMICMGVFAFGTCAADTQTPNKFDVSPEIYYVSYKQPGTQKERGVMYGTNLCYTYRGWLTESDPYINRNMFRADARAVLGLVDQKTVSSGIIRNVRDYAFEFRAIWGYNLVRLKTPTIVPYIGGGYRYLSDDTSERSSNWDINGYERESFYFYSPAGVELSATTKNGWIVTANAEYDHLWRGIQKNKMSANPGYYNMTMNQNKGAGARVSLNLRKQFKAIDLGLEPFIRYWCIQRSDTKTDPAGRGWAEKKNTTSELGIKLTVGF